MHGMLYIGIYWKLSSEILSQDYDLMCSISASSRFSSFHYYILSFLSLFRAFLQRFWFLSFPLRSFDGHCCLQVLSLPSKIPAWYRDCRRLPPQPMACLLSRQPPFLSQPPEVVIEFLFLPKHCSSLFLKSFILLKLPARAPRYLLFLTASYCMLAFLSKCKHVLAIYSYSFLPP